MNIYFNVTVLEIPLLKFIHFVFGWILMMQDFSNIYQFLRVHLFLYLQLVFFLLLHLNVFQKHVGHAFAAITSLSLAEIVDVALANAKGFGNLIQLLLLLSLNIHFIVWNRQMRLSAADFWSLTAASTHILRRKRPLYRFSLFPDGHVNEPFDHFLRLFDVSPQLWPGGYKFRWVVWRTLALS